MFKLKISMPMITPDSRMISTRLFTFIFFISLNVSCICCSFAQETTDKTVINHDPALLPGSSTADAQLSRIYQIFYQANSAYKDGRYDEAIANYEKLISLGWESGNIYYNLGNSYFKKQELGMAVYNYEVARTLVPNDSDLQSNYEYALSELNLGTPSYSNFFRRMMNRLLQVIAADTLAITISVVYILIIALLILNLFFSRLRIYSNSLILSFFVLFILSALALQGKIADFNKAAIIVDKEAQVKFEPLKSGTTYFNLSEGSKVVVIDKVDTWRKIKRPDGKMGWVERGELMQLNNN